MMNIKSYITQNNVEYSDVLLEILKPSLYLTTNKVNSMKVNSKFGGLPDVYKNNTVGNKAANFDLAITKNGKTISTTLHDLDISEQYLVVFWSSTCGHCLDELPKLKTMLANKKGLKVIAFALEDDAENWQNLEMHSM